MNKKGMTLIELIAAIVILSIVSLIAIPAVKRIRNNSLQRDYESKLITIKDAAIDYANERINNVHSTDCYYVRIGVLVETGYLAGDSESKEEILNPLNGEPLNSKMVCVKFNSDNVMTRKLVACIDKLEEC